METFLTWKSSET